jgi:Subtilase family
MIRQLIVVRATDFPFLARPHGTKPASPHELFSQISETLHRLLPGFRKRLGILGVPSLDWEPRLTQDLPDGQELPPPDRHVIALSIQDLATLEEFRQAVEDANNGAGDTAPFPGVGADLSLAESEYFCPTNVDQLLFGDRAAAAALTGSKALKQQGLTGNGVNIVVIDEGFDANMVRNFGGGLIYSPLTGASVQPGATIRGHGMMMVRNILDAAPDATFYDVPLIPPRISNVTGFIGDALGAFTELRLLIGFLRQLGIPPWDGPWILVNAWSIFNRSTEYPPGDYTENPHHPLNVVIDDMVDDAIDIIFAAGNCGQFCPDRRCGKLDVGPGSSIFGANSHPRVLTTGAVRTDALWVGSSSEGPGQPCLFRRKPDLCAPSYFREVGDASLGNLSEPFVGDTGTPFIASTGTSAACALTAGIVGAIRSGWDQYSVPPDKLRYFLNKEARKTEGPGWNERLGHGIIDVEATLSALP